jgi:hypothetical protein
LFDEYQILPRQLQHGNLRQVDLLVARQVQQQVERSLEAVHVDDERRFGGRALRPVVLPDGIHRRRPFVGAAATCCRLVLCRVQAHRSCVAGLAGFSGRAELSGGRRKISVQFIPQRGDMRRVAKPVIMMREHRERLVSPLGCLAGQNRRFSGNRQHFLHDAVAM